MKRFIDLKVGDYIYITGNFFSSKHKILAIIPNYETVFSGFVTRMKIEDVMHPYENIGHNEDYEHISSQGDVYFSNIETQKKYVKDFKIRTIKKLREQFKRLTIKE